MDDHPTDWCSSHGCWHHQCAVRHAWMHLLYQYYNKPLLPAPYHMKSYTDSSNEKAAFARESYDVRSLVMTVNLVLPNCTPSITTEQQLAIQDQLSSKPHWKSIE